MGEMLDRFLMRFKDPHGAAIVIPALAMLLACLAAVPPLVAMAIVLTEKVHWLVGAAAMILCAIGVGFGVTALADWVLAALRRRVKALLADRDQMEEAL